MPSQISSEEGDFVHGSSAFINHHIPASVLNYGQLNLILSERHTKEEWVRLLHAWNIKAQDELKP